MEDQQHNSADSGQSDAGLQAGHQESLEAARELVEQVEQAEQAQGEPVPSQADADETAATGI